MLFGKRSGLPSRQLVAALVFSLSGITALPAVAADSNSKSAELFASWVAASGDAKGMPFLIVDKRNARVIVYSPDGHLRGAAPALLGLARGDQSVPGIGQRKLATITPAERTTPAGRFVASLGNDLGEKDVVWVDYDAAISLHRVVPGTPRERRQQRLASASIADNRISYGCINVAAKFFDGIVRPSFVGTSGIVYILPEVQSIASVFPAYYSNAEARPAS